MGEKIILSKRVAVALEMALSNRLNNKDRVLKSHVEVLNIENKKWKGDNLQYLNELSLEQMALALYVGYEVEETPEERLLNEFKYNNDKYMSSGSGIYLVRNEVIKSTLNTLGIKIEGINK